jgi:peptidyl-prolyl cis-trans isomerase B (cyclophilin B)
MKTFKLNLLCALGSAVLLAAGCSNQKPAAQADATTPTPAPAPATNQSPATTDTGDVAVLDTSDGEMVISFWPDTAPKTVANFEKLARAGFYDGTAFHRIIDGFMVQGGDPNTKDLTKESEYGMGGPGYSIEGEVSNRPDRFHVRGVISMANSGSPDTAGSQFFICLADLQQLNGGYTNDVLEKIAKTPVGPNSQGENSKPLQRVELISVKIVPADSIK